MKHDWLAFLFTLGIMLGISHGWMQDIPTTANAIGASISGATMIEFVVRIVASIKEDRDLERALGLRK